MVSCQQANDALMKSPITEFKRPERVVKFMFELGNKKHDSFIDMDTALVFASAAGLSNIVDMLCKEGADVNTLIDQKRTPLIAAILNGHERIVTFLCTHSDIDVNQRGAMGNTALHLAAALGNLTAVAALISKKASVDLQNDNKMIPSRLARKNGHTTVAKILESVSPKRKLFIGLGGRKSPLPNGTPPQFPVAPPARDTEPRYQAWKKKTSSEDNVESGNLYATIEDGEESVKTATDATVANPLAKRENTYAMASDPVVQDITSKEISPDCTDTDFTERSTMTGTNKTSPGKFNRRRCKKFRYSHRLLSAEGSATIESENGSKTILFRQNSRFVRSDNGAMTFVKESTTVRENEVESEETIPKVVEDIDPLLTPEEHSDDSLDTLVMKLIDSYLANEEFSKKSLRNGPITIHMSCRFDNASFIYHQPDVRQNTTQVQEVTNMVENGTLNVNKSPNYSEAQSGFEDSEEDSDDAEKKFYSSQEDEWPESDDRQPQVRDGKRVTSPEHVGLKERRQQNAMTYLKLPDNTAMKTGTDQSTPIYVNIQQIDAHSTYLKQPQNNNNHHHHHDDSKPEKATGEDNSATSDLSQHTYANLPSSTAHDTDEAVGEKQLRNSGGHRDRDFRKGLLISQSDWETYVAREEKN